MMTSGVMETTGPQQQGRRSLWPVIVAHIVNDAVLIPSVFYLLAAHAAR